MGNAEANIKGSLRPQTLRKRSEIEPINGSEIASTTDAIKKAVPASAGETPRT